MIYIEREVLVWKGVYSFEGLRKNRRFWGQNPKFIEKLKFDKEIILQMFRA